MKKMQARVRGVNRTIYLGSRISDNKWRAKVYVDCENGPGRQTSVAGIFQIYANGARRFTPTGLRSDAL